MKHILCFILVNILVWNISSFVIYRTFQLDGYMSENFDKLGEFDFIDAEYNKVDKKLTDFTAKELPYLKLKILHKSDNSTFTCYGFFGDSTRELNTKNINSILQNRTEYAIRTNNVRNKAKTNLEALKLSKDTLKYQRNRDYFNQKYELNFQILNWIGNSTDTTNAILKFNQNTHIIYINNNINITDKYIKIKEDAVKKYDLKSLAETPMMVLSIFFGFIVVFEYYNMETS